jgi:hypothetical protein
MYRLREMDVDDKVCEQVSMTMLSKIYPKDLVLVCGAKWLRWPEKPIEAQQLLA